jgi:hypothetical protein
MNASILRFFIVFLAMDFSVLICYSQTPLVYDQKEAWFDKTIGRENTELINGPEYFIPFQGASTHPFFGSRELTSEQVLFDGQLYTNVPLLYDIYSDILVLRFRDKNGLFAMIQLDEKKVEGFTLYSHRFRKIDHPKYSESAKGNGYYDILYEGKKIMLVAKRTKARSAGTAKAEYEVDEKYYLIRQNQWSHVSGTGSFYEFIKDKKKQVLSFVKIKKIKVRKKDEKDLITLTSFCDSLIEDPSK